MGMNMSGQLGVKHERAIDHVEKAIRDRRPVQQRVLYWIRMNVPHGADLVDMYYKAVTGWPPGLKMTTELALRFMPADNDGRWLHPYKKGVYIPDRENAIVVSHRLVTEGFRDDIVDNLITEVAAFGNYNFHEIGTSAAAEDNTDTTLTTTSGITLVAGTQVENAANIYESVATITADATETWQEHGIFNIIAAGIMMDRNTFGGVAVVNLDTLETTYRITFNAET